MIGLPRRQAAAAGGFALIMGLAAFALSPSLEGPGSPQDEGALLAFPDAIAEGEWPGRDFLSLYGPGSWLVLTVAFELFGAGVGVERAVGLAYRLLILLAVMLIGLRWSVRQALICGVLATLVLTASAVVWPALAVPFLLSYMLVLMGLALLAHSDRLPALAAGAGVCAGLATLARPEMAVACACVVPVLLGGPHVRRWLAGFLPVIALVAIHYGVLVGPDDLGGLLRDMVNVPAGRRIPIPGPGTATGAILIGAAGSTAALLAIGAVMARREPAEGRWRLMLAIGLLCLAAAPYVAQRASLEHVLAVVVVPIAFAPLLGPALGAAAAGRLRPWQGPALGAALCLWLVWVLCTHPELKDRLPAQALHHERPWARSADVTIGGRSFPLTRGHARRVQPALDRLASVVKPGDRLFVGQRELRLAMYTETYVYFLFDRAEPASYYMSLDPGVANRPGSRLADDLATADWVLLSPEPYRDIEPGNDSGKPGDGRPVEVLRTRFCRVFERSGYEIHRQGACAG